MSNVTSAVFWRATGARVLYTFLATLMPYAALVAAGSVAIVPALSVSGLAAFAALVTAFANLPEINTATMSIGVAILHRVLRTGGQSLAAALVGITLLEGVPWQAALIGAAGAIVTTLIRTFLDVLPESVQQAPAVGAVKEQTGQVIAGEASGLPTGKELNGLPDAVTGAQVVEALDPSASEDGK